MKRKSAGFRLLNLDVPGTMKIDGMEIERVSRAEAETAEFFVCLRWSDPPVLADNAMGLCSQCGTRVQHRPNGPKKPPKLCMECLSLLIEPAAGRA